MKAALNHWLSCCAILLSAVVAGCSDLPVGQGSADSTPVQTTPAPTGSPTIPAPGSATQGSSASSTSAAATSPSSAPVAASATPSQQSALQVQLADGIRLFEQGEFYAAAGRLRNLPDLSNASVATRTTAHKYLAFSYCVTNRRTLCQQQFETALRLDPKFELAPAERGHPIWKVVYERAKKAASTAAGKKSTVKPDPKESTDTKPGDSKSSTVTGASQTKSDDAKPSAKKPTKAKAKKAAADKKAAEQKAAADTKPVTDLKPQ